MTIQSYSSIDTADPVNPQDLATKHYVDNLLGGRVTQNANTNIVVASTTINTWTNCATFTLAAGLWLVISDGYWNTSITPPVTWYLRHYNSTDAVAAATDTRVTSNVSAGSIALPLAVASLWNQNHTITLSIDYQHSATGGSQGLVASHIAIPLLA